MAFRALASSSARRQRKQITRRLYEADANLQEQYRRARRSMNEAAGQSWRNLIDGGRE